VKTRFRTNLSNLYSRRTLLRMQLECAVQTYDWGKLGADSLVYILQSQTQRNLSEDRTYAELWMGTHPNAPSKLIEDSSKTLSSYLQSIYGNLPQQSWEFEERGNLPFLFKVLSVAKPLSIQAHPNKEWAKNLHAQSPEIYKDPNHKPELACALTPFEALCGFRDLQEILSLITSQVPELKELLGNQFVEDVIKSSEPAEARMKLLFERLMNADENQIKFHLQSLISRLESTSQRTELDNLVIRVHREYPGDIGVFCLYFLNYLQLQPGEAMFLGANLPHCYLSGNCVECMACSDNVIRVGLTPKLRDSATLCAMLDYRSNTQEIVSGKKIDSSTFYYPVPVDDFLLYRSEISDSDYEFPAEALRNPGILLVIQGTANVEVVSNFLPGGKHTGNIKMGSVLFIHPNSHLRFSDSKNLHFYYCTCNSS